MLLAFLFLYPDPTVKKLISLFAGPARPVRNVNSHVPARPGPLEKSPLTCRTDPTRPVEKIIPHLSARPVVEIVCHLPSSRAGYVLRAGLGPVQTSSSNKYDDF